MMIFDPYIPSENIVEKFARQMNLEKFSISNPYLDAFMT